ncbi:MAG TPA: hypothetical protein PK467_06665 [Candidatus Wallbacteria bacterium]|nr:hypothetical protein [Candidatus Wallbacteria bacterium]
MGLKTAIKKEIFLMHCAALLGVFFTPLSCACAAGSSEEVRLISPVNSVYVPLYPQNFHSLDSIILCDKNSKFKLVRETAAGYVVEFDGERYLAPAEWYIYDELSGKGPGVWGAGGFDASAFAGVKLPGEIESSEFFFNNASKKSFYSLAFLLFLKNGPAYGGYEQKLRDYDDFMGNAAKKKRNICVIEAFSEFLNSSAPGSAVCVRRRPSPSVIYGLLASGRAAAFMSFKNGAEGEIVIAYGRSLKNGVEKQISCYIHGAGLRSFPAAEFEELAELASGVFMALF